MGRSILLVWWSFTRLCWQDTAGTIYCEDVEWYSLWTMFLLQEAVERSYWGDSELIELKGPPYSWFAGCPPIRMLPMVRVEMIFLVSTRPLPACTSPVGRPNIGRTRNVEWTDTSIRRFCFAVFSAGETQIWPGDLCVVAVAVFLSGRLCCWFFVFLVGLAMIRLTWSHSVSSFCTAFTASLTVRTEP